MQALTVQVNPQAQPAVFTPKLNYGFYLQTRDDKLLAKNGQDGFSALVNGLLDENVDDILKSLQANDFLARKLNEFIKNNDKLTATMKKHIESMTDEDKKDQMEIGMTQIDDATTKLQQLMTSQESSPKQDESDSHLLN